MTEGRCTRDGDAAHAAAPLSQERPNVSAGERSHCGLPGRRPLLLPLAAVLLVAGIEAPRCAQRVGRFEVQPSLPRMRRSRTLRISRSRSVAAENSRWCIDVQLLCNLSVCT